MLWVKSGLFIMESIDDGSPGTRQFNGFPQPNSDARVCGEARFPFELNIVRPDCLPGSQLLNAWG